MGEQIPRGPRTRRGTTKDPQPTIAIGLGGLLANGRTFIALKSAYAGYATPTDLLALRNPVGSGRILVPRVMSMLAHSTAAALMKFSFYRRSQLNTGGTPVDLTAVKYDSEQDDAAGVARVYGSLPVLNGPAAPLLNLHWGSTAVPANAPFNFNSSGLSFGWALNTSDFVSPIVLHEGEELVMNLEGAALPAGFVAQCGITWVEFDTPS